MELDPGTDRFRNSGPLATEISPRRNENARRARVAWCEFFVACPCNTPLTPCGLVSMAKAVPYSGAASVYQHDEALVEISCDRSTRRSPGRRDNTAENRRIAHWCAMLVVDLPPLMHRCMAGPSPDAVCNVRVDMVQARAMQAESAAG